MSCHRNALGFSQRCCAVVLVVVFASRAFCCSILHDRSSVCDSRTSLGSQVCETRQMRSFTRLVRPYPTAVAADRSSYCFCVLIRRTLVLTQLSGGTTSSTDNPTGTAR
eukprot:2318227-Rhodomonas_salina.9